MRTQRDFTVLVIAVTPIDPIPQRRWERVAEVVPGKTKVQCFKRFKELREAFRGRKAGDGGAGPDVGDG